MSEEENLPTAEEMRARYADLMDETPAEAPSDESTADSPQSTEPEPEPEPAAEDDTLPSPEEMRARYADLMNEDEAAPEPEAPAAGHLPPATPEPEAMADPADDLAAHLLDVKVRFWAELGRSRMPLAEAVALGAGAIVDLDTEPDEELDVLVNGLPFAKGKLLLVDGEWAIRLEQIVATPEAVEHASNSGSEA